MSVELLNVDVSEQILVRGANTAAITDILGQIAQSRSYSIADHVGEINPFASSGLLFLNSWRNETIKETEVNEREVFTGSIKRVGMRFDRAGFQTTIQAVEPIATFLKFFVEENDSTTHSGFLVNAAQSAGAQTITIDTGTTDIPAGAQVTFSKFLVPRYQVTASSGSPTTSITLDRPISEDLADNTAVRISLPTSKTIPAAIFDSLVAAGLGDRLGANFGLLDTQEVSRTITMFIRIEDEIELGSHVSKLLELGNFSLSVNAAGTLDLIDDLAWDGSEIVDKLTASELIDPYEIKYNDSRLVIGYDLLFISGNNVEVASGDVDQTIIQEYGGVKPWQPISSRGSLPIEYPYLYSDATTADFYGAKYLDYWGVPRVRVSAKMKQSISSNPLQRIQAQVGKEFALTIPVATNQSLLEEPSRLIAYQYNESQQVFDQVVFELTNFPSPNVPREVDAPTEPEIIEFFEVNEGVNTVFKTFTGTLVIEVFLADKVTRIAIQELICSPEAESSECAALYQSSILNNGAKYAARYFTRSGGIESTKTDFISFTPESQGTLIYGVGKYGINEYA